MFDDKQPTVFRTLDGILLLDKPQGLSSNQALQRARHLFRAEKAGHTGSLDPLATGLLPLCFGEATKIAGLLLGARKAYETVARLGITTDTDDADGQPLRERRCRALTIAADRGRAGAAARPHPPARADLFGAQAGRRAAVRQGAARRVDRSRPSAMSRSTRFELLARPATATPLLRLQVECGSGTYVRSLVRDLGEALGCGAHVAELRRLWVDPFREPRMLTLEALQALADTASAASTPACCRSRPA